MIMQDDIKVHKFLHPYVYPNRYSPRIFPPEEVFAMLPDKITTPTKNIIGFEGIEIHLVRKRLFLFKDFGTICACWVLRKIFHTREA